MRISSYFAYVLLAAFAFLTGCATNPVTGESQIMLISGSQERALGLEADKGVREEYGVYDNPALQAYVNDIGQKLAAQSQRAGLDWKFTVVDSPEINAFALPGGFIYITRGLMAYLDNEAELAGVLGHEIGHVTARHGVEQQSKGLLVGLGGVALELLTGVSGVSDLTSSLATVGYLLPKSREHELQADQLGAEYLSRTNYNPDSMVKVIEVLKLQEQFANDQSRNKATRAERLPNWLSTHPSNDQRLSQIEVIANQYAGQYGDPGRTRYLQKINGMVFGDSRAQGVARGRNFYHEPLGFALRAPEGWQFQNSPKQLIVANEDASAYVIMGLSPDSRGNQEQAIRDILKPDRGRSERTTINGLPATHFRGSREGKNIEATVITVKGSDLVLLMAAKTPEALSRERRELRSIIDSFRPLTPEDAKLAKPYTLRTQTMPKAAVGQGFRELAKKAPDLGSTEEKLRLLNHAYPEGDVASGTLIKTIQ